MSRWNFAFHAVLGLALSMCGAAIGDEPQEPAATNAGELESAVDRLGVDEPSDRTALRVVLDSRREDGQPQHQATELRLHVGGETVADEPALDGTPSESAEPETVEDDPPTNEEPSDEEAPSDETDSGEQPTGAANGLPKPLDVPSPPLDLATPELSPRLLELRAKVRRVLGYYFNRNLNTRDHNPWEMMHGVIAYGCDTKIRRGGPDGPAINGIAWLSVNGECHGVRLLTINRRGELDAQVGQYVQGHPGQLMAILAQCHVPMNYPIVWNGRDLAMRDLIETEMKSCQAGTELTFKLIGLSHYLDTETTWKDHRGETWSISRLIQEEIKQPILYTAACGGTHRLMGLSYCNFKRVKEGRTIVGQFARAKKYVQDYHRYAFALQNPDGSFSTDWFKGRQNKPDVDRKLKTTGHITEWLAFSLPEDQLTDPRMVRAVDFIATILDKGRDHKWEIGPIGHGLHALRIYDRRLFKPLDVPASEEPETNQSPQPLAAEAGDPPTAEMAATDRDKDQRTAADRRSAKDAPDESAAIDEVAAPVDGDEPTAGVDSGSVEIEPTATSDENSEDKSDASAVNPEASATVAPTAAAPRSRPALTPARPDAKSNQAADRRIGQPAPPATSSEATLPLQFRRRKATPANPFRDEELRMGGRTRTLR